MMEPPKSLKELQNTIKVLESQRDILGNDVVESSIAALKKEIADLKPAFKQERKLVSILFCDIVGSSQIAAERDPEEVLNIINGALHEINLAVESFGGIISRYMGDGILAIFGAPIAQERHAEQAVRVGLEIHKRIKVYSEYLQTGHNITNFQVRVGINSGKVVAGGVGGEKGEYTVIGDAVNMASRFEGAAPPGGILIGETTFQLAGGNQNFETQAWDPIEVKGSPQPQTVYQVIGISDRSHSKVVANAPLTGRRFEMSVLQAKYEEVVAQGKLKIVHVIGPAGIGKSRLGKEFISWLETLSALPRVSVGRALPYTRGIPFALASNLLNASLKIRESDSVEQRRETLQTDWKNLGGLNTEQLYFLAEMISVDLPESNLNDLEPQARKELLFDAFISYWKRQSQQNILVLFLEDIQWADSLSLVLIENLAVALQNAGVFIVMFSRPDKKQDEQQPLFQAKLRKGTIEKIVLKELNANETREMVKGLLNSSDFPLELIDIIDLKAQGNPFFIEEIINSLLEDGSLPPQIAGRDLTRELVNFRVPDTVQGVLADRIDRLDQDDKEVLQYAAIIGSSFSPKLLVDLLGREIEKSLKSLEEKDFIAKFGSATLIDDQEWQFRHVLVQEVAYESVLLDVRRKTHFRIAKYLENIVQDKADELSPTLAYHFEHSKDWNRAIFYLGLAAKRSARVFALPEALVLYSRAIQMIKAHPDDNSQEILQGLYEDRGDVHALAYDFDDAESDYQIVLAAARSAGDRTREQRILVRLGFLYRTADRLEKAVEHLNAGLNLAHESGDLHTVADTLYHLGTVAWSKGDNATALRNQQEAVNICRQLGLKDLVAVQALHGLAEAQSVTGKAQQAVKNYQESIKLSRKIGDKSYESENLYMLASVCNGKWGIGDYDLGRRSVNMSLEISRKAHLDGHTAPALQIAGAIYSGAGDYQRALDLINEALNWSENAGVIRFQTAIYLHLGSLYRDINLYEKARAADERGLQIATDYGVGYLLLNLQAGLAIDRLHLGDHNVAQDLLDTYKQAQQQGQGMWGLRCLVGLAEWAMMSGELKTVLEYCNKIQEISEAGGMREIAARARKFRGEALTALEKFDEAEKELQRALEAATEIKGVRLIWDVHVGLENLYRAWGKESEAQEHQANIISIVNNIRENLLDDEMKAGLPDYSN